ncbi:MAG: type 1 glutamine amidotransferase [Clostridia bacterium]|nr:type 1 glutamine amidotransferase [Clostridia bacterium]
MIKRPKILLSQDVLNYKEAITLSGGTAVTEFNENEEYDGLLLCGGCDIHPMFYGEEISGAVNIDVERDKKELLLLRHFVNKKLSVLGICRGLQLINVHFGGTHIQDIKEKQRHQKEGDAVHKVTAQDELEEMYGKEFFVNSNHHQAIDVLGNGLSVIAECDGIIEAVRHDFLPVFAVQFHPERMCYNRLRTDTVDGKSIFIKFLNECKNR